MRKFFGCFLLYLITLSQFEKKVVTKANDFLNFFSSLTSFSIQVAEGLPGIHKAEILQLCDEVDNLARQLSDLCARGEGNSPRAQEIARQLSQKLNELKNKIQQAVVSRVVEDFIDITTPLKQFTEAVLAPEGTPNREQNFNDKTLNLQNFSNRAAKTARMVAAGGRFSFEKNCCIQLIWYLKFLTFWGRPYFFVNKFLIVFNKKFLFIKACSNKNKFIRKRLI